MLLVASLNEPQPGPNPRSGTLYGGEPLDTKTALRFTTGTADPSRAAEAHPEPFRSRWILSRNAGVRINRPGALDHGDSGR